MPSDKEPPDFAAIDNYINEQSGDILDGNAEAMSYLRKSAMKIIEFKERQGECFDNAVEAIAVSMLMMADLHGDMLLEELQEWGVDIQKVEASEDEDE